MSAPFDRDAIACFRFVRADFDAASGVVELAYAFDDGTEMVETLRIPGAPFVLDAARATAVRRALTLVHLIAGVSYYKAAVPPRIELGAGIDLDAASAAFLDALYLNGLGEFAYRNGLDLRQRIRFPATCEELPAAPALGLSAGALTAIGGGKDSLVSIELLRAEGVPQTLSWIGGAPLIRACAERTGLPMLAIERQLAPELFELNRRGALNGHIPVTAINSAILALAALLHGVDAVVFSNERSASYGSLIPGTGEVNHQWSKGWAFEQAFAAELRRVVAADLDYFSLLRPLSELAVARQFARLDGYDAHFSSCNRNFHLLGERPASRWCGVCPKCHFVFLALAPFMPKPRLVGIFGRNLLDEAEQARGFDALIEFNDHKPFECVGEARESRAAFAALAASPVWREDALVARFAAEIAPHIDAAGLDIDSLLRPEGPHGIPAALWTRIHAAIAA
ncbi:MAG: UDP-N-acetyl-alpha-D-muramoyl-L-alanyl-L-glutamate epimerase [Lysobacteraceae bacterium]